MDAKRGAIWFGVLALYTLGAHAILLLDQPTVHALVGEDGWYENTGAIGLALAGVFLLLAFVRSRKRPGDLLLVQLFLLLMAAVFLFGAGEEIAWGQRILGLETPEAIRAANFQQEITVHNLDTIYGLPIRPYRLFTMPWFTVVFAVPLLCSIYPPARRFFARLIPLVPWTLGAVFLFNELFSKGAEAVIAADLLPHRDNDRVEIRESVFGVLCASTAFYIFHHLVAVARPSEAPARVGIVARATRAGARSSAPQAERAMAIRD